MKRMITLGVLLAVLGFGDGQAIAAMDPPKVPLKGQEGPGIRAKVPPRDLEGPDVRRSTLPLPQGSRGAGRPLAEAPVLTEGEPHRLAGPGRAL